MNYSTIFPYFLEENGHISTDTMWYNNGTIHYHQTSLPVPVYVGCVLSLEGRYGGDFIIGTLSKGPLKLLKTLIKSNFTN